MKQHPVTADYGKTWSLSLPQSQYWYDEKARECLDREWMG